MIGPRRFSVVLVCVSLAFLLTSCEKPFGEYDHRDIPSSIHISAKTEGNLHAHATAIFQATNAFPIVCTGVFNQGLTDRDERYADISTEGIDIPIKQKWRGLCSYQFRLLAITCTDSSIHPDNDKKNIGSKDAIFDPAVGIYNHLSQHPNFNGNELMIVNSEPDIQEFYNCRKSCEENRWFSFRSTTQEINVECAIGPQTND